MHAVCTLPTSCHIGSMLQLVNNIFCIWNSTLYAHCLHTGNTLYLYLVALNAKIKLFTDKEVTNWIHNKLKHKKYHEVLKLTMGEFIEQEKTKKHREEDADKTQPHRGPELLKARKVIIICFNIHCADSMRTVCRV